MTSKGYIGDLPTPRGDGLNDLFPFPSRKSTIGPFDSWKVGENYRMLQILGQGSYGEVAKAIDQRYVIPLILTIHFLTQCEENGWL